MFRRLFPAVRIAKAQDDLLWAIQLESKDKTS